MVYADSDFFIALLMPNDRHRVWARAAYGKHKGDITTSLATVMELLLIAERFNMTAQALMAGVLVAARLTGVEENDVLRAAYLIDNYKVGIFDAFHAALCGGKIISTDHIFGILGIDTNV
ncbi:MAG TPA: PIN domain-containing protein [Candidatus Baltobacteraceae bacterium]|nr:PIN domain-containing protein [Candidatus Baltobacteraceae bacterium]